MGTTDMFHILLTSSVSVSFSIHRHSFYAMNNLKYLKSSIPGPSSYYYRDRVTVDDKKMDKPFPVNFRLTSFLVSWGPRYMLLSVTLNRLPDVGLHTYDVFAPQHSPSMMNIK